MGLSEQEASSFIGPRRPIKEYNLEPGQVIAGHVVDQPISMTGFYEVWLAQHPDFGETVIKTPGLHNFLDETDETSVRKRLFTEVIALEILIDHPGIIDIYGRDIHHPEHPYLALPYVRGFPLSHLIRTDTRTLAPYTSLSLCIGILEALEYVHSKEILHLDLKPENIMVTSSPTGLVPLLIDFNICRLPKEFDWVGIDEEEYRFTTPYAAPEQPFSRQHDLSVQTDLYPVAKMLNELLTGESYAPVEPSNKYEQVVYFQRLSKDQGFIFPSFIHPDLAPFDHVFMRSLHYEPCLRHLSARDFKEDLLTIRERLLTPNRVGSLDLLISSKDASHQPSTSAMWNELREQIPQTEKEKTEVIKKIYRSVPTEKMYDTHAATTGSLQLV